MSGTPVRNLRDILLAVVIACAFLPVRGLSAAVPAPVSFNPGTPRTDNGQFGALDVEARDFDGDGRLDVLVVTGQNEAHLLEGDGIGGFAGQQRIVAFYASGAASGDFNGDGWPDLAVTQSSNKSLFHPTPNPDPCGDTTGTLVLLNNRTSPPGFTLLGCVQGGGPPGTDYLSDVVAADFTGDGTLDLAVADQNLFGLRVYPGNGDGTFGAKILALNAIPTFGPMKAVDVDGDGDLDLIVAVSGGAGLYTNNGAGALTFHSTPAGVPTTSATQREAIVSLAAGDVNGDGFTDLVGVAQITDTLTSAIQNYLFSSLAIPNPSTLLHDGLFYSLDAAATALPTSSGNPAVGRTALLDLNKDHALDVVVVDRGGSSVRVFLGRGDGTFAGGPVITAGWVNPTLVVPGDLNGDFWKDLAVVDDPDGNSGTYVVTQVPGVGDATPPTVALTAPAAGSALQGTVTLAATASDPSGLQAVEFFRDAAFIGSANLGVPPYSIQWQTGAVPNGTYMLSARATDTLDNVATSSGVTVTIANTDSTAPSVSLTVTPDPAVPAGTSPGGLLGGTPTLAAAATDANGVTRVDFLDGTTLVGSDTAAPFSLPWNTSALPPGGHTLMARAFDAAGNVGQASLTVTVDHPPVADAGPYQLLEATSPAGASVALNGSGSADPDTPYGDALAYEWTEGLVGLGTTPTLTVTLSPNTFHALALKVTDSFGWSSVAYVQVDVVDTTGPALTLPPNLTVETASAVGAVVSYGVSAADLVEGSVPVSCDSPSGSNFPLGLTTVTCTAADSLGNTSTGSFTVTVTQVVPPPVVATAVTPSPASPQPYGTSITWTAVASGGTAPLQYEFWRYCTANPGWSMVQAYGASASYTWTPGAGDVGLCYLHVRVRSNGSSQVYEAYFDAPSFQITSIVPIVISSITADRTSPVQVGIPITWTTTATGGSGNVELQYWLYRSASGQWAMVRDYSTTPTFTWTPAAADVGFVLVHVRARNAGSTPFESYADSTVMRITSAAPVTLTAVSASPPLPVQVNTPVVWTATATGGVAPLQYQFWRYSKTAGAWSLVRDYLPDATYSWTPAPAEAGIYGLHVRVRSNGSTAVYEHYFDTPMFALTTSPPATLLSFTPSVPSSIVNAPVTWTAVGAVLNGVPEYQFWQYSYATKAWTLLQDFSPTAFVVWTPSQAGTYLFQVQARRQGSSLPFESYLKVAGFVVVP